MAERIELAQAYIPLIPSMQGIKGNIERELSANIMPAATQVGRSLGAEIGSQAASQLTSTRSQIMRAFGGLGADLTRTATKGFNLAGPIGAEVKTIQGHAKNIASAFSSGFKDADAAASSFTGKMGTLGGKIRTAIDPAAKPIFNFASGFQQSEAAASSFTGKMGTLGGKIRTATDNAVRPINNFKLGFDNADRAASSFTGKMGTLGGKVHDSLQTAGKPVNFLAEKFQGLGTRVKGVFEPGISHIRNFKAGLETADAAVHPLASRMEKLGAKVAGIGNDFGTFRTRVRTALQDTQADAASAFSAIEGSAERAGAESGNKFSNGIKLGVTSAGIALAGLFGTALVQGFNRLSSIENAEAKLLGLGNSAESVSAIMDNALISVKGTAFGMDEAATTAASAVAAGIEPGMELERYLRLVGDAATIAGTDMASMGSIFNKVATSGKVQGDVFAQLSDAGIPVVQMLADTIGVTAEEIYKMGSEGKISAEQFLEAMSLMEGAALKGGDTTTGAFKNMNAAVSRFGAALLTGVYPLIGPIFGAITEWIDKATASVTPMAEAFGVWVVDAFEAAKDGAQWLTSALVENQDVIVPLMAGIGAGVAVWYAWHGAIKLATLATTLYGKAAKIAGAATLFMTSPIGITVLAIGALVAGVMLAYNHIGWFRDLVQLAWGQIQVAIGHVADWWTTTAWPAIQVGLEQLGIWFTALYNDYVVPAWAGIVSVISWAWGSIVQPLFAAVVDVVQHLLAPIFMWLWSDILVPAWNGIVSVISWAWNTIIAPLFSMIISVIRDILAPTFSWLWTNIITPVWQGISAAISWAWNTIIKPIFSLVVWTLQNVVGPIFWWLFNNVITPVWTGIRLAIEFAWKLIEIVFSLMKAFITNVLGPVFVWLWENVITPVWDWISQKISSTWNWIKTNVFEPLGAYLTGPFQDFWKSARDGIGKIWNGLEEVVKKPIRIVVNTVINDGLIAGYNKLNDFWEEGANGDIAPIKLGFRGGGYTGAGNPYEVAGVVHRGEYVIPKEATSAIIRDHGMGYLSGLRHYEKRRRQAGAASGGAGAHCAHCAQQAASGAAVGHSTTASTNGAPPYGPNGIWGGFQQQISQAGRLFVPKKRLLGVDTERVAQAWMGRSAVEIIVGNGTPSVAFHTGGQGTYGFNSGPNIWLQPGVPDNLKEAVLIHELGHALSLHHTMNTGSIMHPLQAGPTWPSALDYGSLVAAWGKPGDGVKTYEGGGGLWSMLVDKAREMITDQVSALAGKARGLFPGNGWVDAPIGIGEKAAISVVDKAAEFFGGSSDAGVGGGAEQWRGTITKALAMNGLPTTPEYVEAWLRQVQSESGGNPRAVQNGYVDINTGGNEAAGLLQVIPSTFAAYRSPSLPNDRFDPLASAYAGMNYAKNRYGVAGMLKVIGHGHGYRNGGLVGSIGGIETALYDNGGWLTNTGKAQLIEHKRRDPDAVLTSAQWADISKLAERGAAVTNNRGVTIEGDLVAADPQEAIRLMETRLQRREALAIG